MNLEDAARFAIEKLKAYLEDEVAVVFDGSTEIIERLERGLEHHGTGANLESVA
jgi:hypothetical protein